MAATPSPADGEASSLARSLAIALLAIAGLAFHLSPWSDRANLVLVDAAFGVLRAIQPKPAPHDIVIVGMGGASAGLGGDAVDPMFRKMPDALVRIARGKPRAVALEVVLPSASLESTLPGFDDAMATALVVTQAAAPLVIGMAVDSRRQLVPIHEPLLRGVDSRAFAFTLLPRDDDGVVRQVVLALPTRQGSWPTLSGWLCEVLSARCEEGMIDYALGPDYTVLPLKRLLDIRDDETLGRLFKDRIVFVAPVDRLQDRVPLAARLAGWESVSWDAPAVLGHAQTLRTLLHGRPVREIPLPMAIVVIAAAALLARVPRALAWPSLGLATAGALVGGLVALRFGYHVPLAAPLATLVVAPLVGRWLRGGARAEPRT
jgi:CHASE2 domain-containing sensor protein